MGADGAAQFFTYLAEGLFLDSHTQALTAEVVTYNAPLRIFGYFFVEFYFSAGGSIKVFFFFGKGILMSQLFILFTVTLQQFRIH